MHPAATKERKLQVFDFTDISGALIILGNEIEHTLIRRLSRNALTTFVRLEGAFKRNRFRTFAARSIELLLHCHIAVYATSRISYLFDVTSRNPSVA